MDHKSSEPSQPAPPQGADPNEVRPRVTGRSSPARIFLQAAEKVSAWAGSGQAFLLAFLSVVIWLMTGPFVGYSDTWQLTINTGTSVITFLMVFLIQKTQDRDTKAVHLKLNELIAAVEGASNRLIGAEQLDDEALLRLHARFETLAETVRHATEVAGSRSVEEIPHPEEVPETDDQPEILEVIHRETEITVRPVP
jgi:low affinity Fe/Cu permease